MHSFKVLLAVSVAFVLGTKAQADGLKKPTFNVLPSISLPGDGGWDYLLGDSASRRLYVTHDTQVQVLDLDTQKLVGSIQGTHRCHGVALAPDLGKGFISNGADNGIFVFDLKTLKKIGDIKTGKNPDALLFEPSTSRVLAFNGADGTATVADAKTGKIVGTITLGGKPEFAATDGKGMVFDNLEDKNQLIEIDAQALTILNRWDIAPGDSPSALAMDAKKDLLFIGCHNRKMLVMDAKTGKVLQDLFIGKGVDAIAFDPEKSLVIAACGEGVLNVFGPNKSGHYHEIQKVSTEPGARTLGLDSKMSRVYLSSAQFLPSPTPSSKSPRAWRQPAPGTFHLVVVGP